jgi:DNA-binding NtrC family response regulator
MFLAVRQFEECEHVLRELEQRTSIDPALRLAYNVRWLGVTKARLLLRRNEIQPALTVIADTKRTATEVGDQPLLAMLHLTAAQAFAAFGRPRQAALALIAAENVGATAFREIHAQHYYASALTLGDADEQLERQLRARAFRLWNYHGIVSIPLEMSTERTAPPESGSTPPRTLESLADAVAATFDLAFSPSLLGTELVNIVKALDCSSAPQVVSRTSDRVPASDETVSVSLGREGHKAYTLTCPIPPDPRRAILLGDVLRIGRAAVELERYRQEERNRAALWPADPIETEAGALFIAEEMQTLLSTARRLASANIPVLITGETGTGKEVLARLIHAYSNRAKATFLPFNCSATPKDMLDSQLFGHRRGSFTGAVDNFPGVIRAASGGTLFLDEIGEMTLDVQPKLLRFLESGEVHPIGEAHPMKADVRVIAATNADLDALVSEGRFRDDLYYRLNIVRLHMPPLRERRVEIPALANHYLQKYAKENGKGDLRLAEETMEYLLLYRWPGNVRRLANEMRRMAALAERSAVLMPEHLSAEIFASRRTIPASERTLEPTELVVRLDQPMAAAVQHVERAMIMYAMKKSGGGMEETAALLGLSRKGLYLKRQRYAIETPGDVVAVA